MGRWLAGAGIAWGFCALAWASPAGATITGSQITSPATGSRFVYDADTGAGSVLVKGTATGSGSVDIDCYYDSDGTDKSLATAVHVNSGHFATNVSLSQAKGQVCRLRAVPAGSSLVGSGTAPFAGPVIVVDDRESNWTQGLGSLYDYYGYASTTTAGFDFDSLGDYALDDSYLIDPNTLTKTHLFYGNAWLYSGNQTSTNSPTRSSVEVDGHNAYPPYAVPSTLRDESGFIPLSYSFALNPATGTIAIHDTETLMSCGSPGGYPPTTTTCPSLHSADVRVTQVQSTLPGDRVARMSQTFSSTNGSAHVLDLLFWQDEDTPTAGKSPGFRFPGQSTYSHRAPPYSFSTFPHGPGSIFAVGDPTTAPSVTNPIGAITYSGPPLSAYFIAGPSPQQVQLLMHYHVTVPAHGSITFRWAFSDAASASALAPLERNERDHMAPPTVTITAPHQGAVTHVNRIKVQGEASDNVGVSSLTVDGKHVALSGGKFSDSVRLKPGPNKITVTAEDASGNETSATVTVKYKPPKH